MKYYWAGLLLLTGGVFFGHHRWILHHFLQDGAFLYDSGWFAALIHHSDLGLSNPLALGEYFYGKSYLTVHTSFFLIPFGLLSWLLPLGLPEYYALFQASVYASLTWILGFCGAESVRLASRDGERGGPWFTAVALVVALVLTALFSVNGIVLAAAAFPHFEMLIPGLAILVLVLLSRVLRQEGVGLGGGEGSRVGGGTVAALLAAWVFLVLVREDAGFHLAAVLLLAGLLCAASGLGWRKWRWLGGLAVASVAASVLLLVCQKVFFGGDSALQRVYLGDPLYAHLSADLLAERWQHLLHDRVYIWLPWVLAASAAMVLRNPWMFVGVLAYIPWFLFNFFSVSEAPGHFHSYYAFPFFVAQAWPLVCAVLCPSLKRELQGDPLPLEEAKGASGQPRGCLRGFAAVGGCFLRLLKVDAPSDPRKHWAQCAAVAALVACSSAVGFWKSEPQVLRHLVFRMTTPLTVEPGRYGMILQTLQADPALAQSLLVDGGVASLSPRLFAATQLLDRPEFAFPPDRRLALLFLNGSSTAANQQALGRHGFAYLHPIAGTALAFACPEPVLPEPWAAIGLHPPQALLFRFLVPNQARAQGTTPDPDPLTGDATASGDLGRAAVHQGTDPPGVWAGVGQFVRAWVTWILGEDPALSNPSAKARELRFEGGGPPDWLFFGPFWDLPPGAYEIVVTYRARSLSSEPAEVGMEAIAESGVVRFGRTSAKVPLEDDGQSREIRLRLQVDDPATAFEVRMYRIGNLSITLSDAVLHRRP